MCCLMLPFIIVNLVYANNNDSQCLTEPILSPPIHLTLKTWLLVDAYTMLAVLIFFLLAAIAFCVNSALGVACSCCAVTVLILFSIFRFAWLIVGAIMFWGYLNPRETCDSSLSAYMWAMLIIEILLHSCGFCRCCKGGNMYGSSLPFTLDR